ncbi:MAG: GrpB family protein, partial [Bacteroidota bacterium]
MLIQDYRAYWPIDFARLSEVLTAALAGTNHHIEHVGSTAVPGLAAKPIIDLDVVYYAPEAFGEIKDSLEQLGYYHNGDQGIPGREVFKRKT